MELGLTIPLRKHLDLKDIFYGEEQNLFYCWEVHNIIIQGKDTLTAVNAHNRFAVVLWNINKKDWEQMIPTMKRAIRKAFYKEGYTKEQVDLYFEKAGSWSLTKTHGRRSVASLNKMIDQLRRYPMEMKKSVLYQEMHSYLVNREIGKTAGYEERGYAVEFLKLDMIRLEETE